MFNSQETEKKMNKAKSFNAQTSLSPPIKEKNEAVKRKSFDLNDAVRSLDLANRLKKSKLVNGECVSTSSSPTSHKKRMYPDMFMDVCSSATHPGIDNASLMSMNFSHYELMRNLSNSHCNSDGAVSSTCNVRSTDTNVRNEHLERYFRSVEIWSQKYRDGSTSSFNPNQLDK